MQKDKNNYRKSLGPRTVPNEVLVCAVAAKSNERESILVERLKLLSELWCAGISAETQYKLNPKALSQFQHCEDKGIPFALIVAPEEVKQGVVKLRNTKIREEISLPRTDVVLKVKELLSAVDCS